MADGNGTNKRQMVVRCYRLKGSKAIEFGRDSSHKLKSKHLNNDDNHNSYIHVCWILLQLPHSILVRFTGQATR